jgi:hypothetical protein
MARRVVPERGVWELDQGYPQHECLCAALNSAPVGKRHFSNFFVGNDYYSTLLIKDVPEAVNVGQQSNIVEFYLR